MAVESPAWANAIGSYTAEQTRRAVFAQYARTVANSPGIISGGLLSTADLQMTAPGSGMSVNVSTGEAIIGGSEGGAQGGYYARATSTTNLSIAAANATNPRIDTVCATISDAGYTEPVGGSGNQWALQVVTGTATVGATLVNLTGAAALPLSSLLLGYVLVPALSVNVITGNIANKATPAPMNAGGALQALTTSPAIKFQFGTSSTISVSANGNYAINLPTTWSTNHFLFYAFPVTASVSFVNLTTFGMQPTSAGQGVWIGGSSATQNVTFTWFSLGN